MLGSASKNEGARPLRNSGAPVSHGLICPAQWDSESARRLEVCPTVPVVSPILKLINKRRELRHSESGKGTRGIKRRQAPCAGTSGTGAKVTRVCGETTGARHTWANWDRCPGGQGGKVRPLNLAVFA
jgi:hypothetical protein